MTQKNSTPSGIDLSVTASSIKRFAAGLLAALLPFLAAGQASAGKEPPPNVIVIFVDDLGYGDVGCYGATMVSTPNIDRLAREGKMFSDAHAASAVCSPSRYALITGEYPCRKDYWSPIFLKRKLMIDKDQTTIADVMKRSGYATAAIGKWHLGFGETEPVDWNKELKPGPLELGFDYYFGMPVVGSHPPFVYVENHRVLGWTPDDPFVYGKKAETEAFPEKRNLDEIGGAKEAHALFRDRMVGTTMKDTALSWIRRNKTNPFFLYYATTNIHHPFTPAERFVGTSKAGPYGDFIHELDWLVGEILDLLDDEGLAENTLVIFTSDNGGMLNAGGQQALKAGHKANADLLGFKFDAWEGGHRVPFIARWPGKIPANSKSEQLVSNVDLLGTMGALTGIKLDHEEGPDSYNILPALTGDPKKPIRDHLVISPLKKQNLAFRKGKWMYISSKDGGGFSAAEVGASQLGGSAAFPFTGQTNSDIDGSTGKLRPEAAPAQLYDLEKDPQQKTNVYNQFPKVAAGMKAALEKTIRQPYTAPRK